MTSRTYQSDDERIYCGNSTAASYYMKKFEDRNAHVNRKRINLEWQLQLQDVFPRGHIHSLNITNVSSKHAATVQSYGNQLKTDNPI